MRQALTTKNKNKTKHKPFKIWKKEHFIFSRLDQCFYIFVPNMYWRQYSTPGLCLQTRTTLQHLWINMFALMSCSLCAKLLSSLSELDLCVFYLLDLFWPKKKWITGWMFHIKHTQCVIIKLCNFARGASAAHWLPILGKSSVTLILFTDITEQPNGKTFKINL